MDQSSGITNKLEVKVINKQFNIATKHPLSPYLSAQLYMLVSLLLANASESQP